MLPGSTTKSARRLWGEGVKLRQSQSWQHGMPGVMTPTSEPARAVRSGQGGDHVIARDVTALFTEGWDWMQPVRDRDIGIFDSVELAFVGPVALQDPHVSVDQLQAAPLQQLSMHAGKQPACI